VTTVIFMTTLANDIEYDTLINTGRQVFNTITVYQLDIFMSYAIS